MATRQLYWNIEGHDLLYPLFLIALGILIYGIYRRKKLWQIGRQEKRGQDIGQGIKDIFTYGFFHKRIIKDVYAGSMHLFIFWGFAVLFFATMIVALQTDFGIPLFQGGLYLFIKFTSNLFGFFAILGVVMAAWRRYGIRPKGLDSKPDDAITLALIFLILVTGFLLEGIRIAAQPDPWANWEFVGQWLSQPLGSLDHAVLIGLHRIIWWFHLILVMVFIGYFPYSKLLHILLAPLNIFLRKRGPIGVPTLIDFEDESIEAFGTSQLSELPWKNLFDTDVCLRCGRCQDNCPAFISGKSLSPKRIIQDIKLHMEETGKTLELTKKEAGCSDGKEITSDSELPSALEARSLIGEVIQEEDLWSCTTCRSCEQQCPVFIEHVDKTIEMRRYLVMMESRFPSEAQQAFRNMENNGNPWGIGWSNRGDYFKALGVPTIEENPDAEILYWPGCSGAFDSRNQKVSKALVSLLQAAKVNFAILGNEEKCCGDSARKLGNEYLYISLATENIEVMKGYGVKKILTQCPHCFNLLKNEYRQLGGHYQVVHHTEFLFDLVRDGKLKFNLASGTSITYHDSCYLSRYNKIYDVPRELLKAAGLELKEMPHSLEKSFCCGAGGGRMWLEEHAGERINVLRAREAIEMHTDMIGTACPFCLTMLKDGTASLEISKDIKTLDIAEILEQALHR